MVWYGAPLWPAQPWSRKGSALSPKALSAPHGRDWGMAATALTALLCCGLSTLAPAQGEVTQGQLGTCGGRNEEDRETQAPAHLCPMERGGSVGAEKLQFSLELGENRAQQWGRPSPVCSAWVLGWGPGRVRRRPPRTHGACCRLLLSWRGSKSNILQGRYFPCSAHAQFKRPLCSSKRASGLLFLMHTVKGKKITVIHLLRACGHQNIFCFNHQ